MNLRLDFDDSLRHGGLGSEIEVGVHTGGLSPSTTTKATARGMSYQAGHGQRFDLDEVERCRDRFDRLVNTETMSGTGEQLASAVRDFVDSREPDRMTDLWRGIEGVAFAQTTMLKAALSHRYSFSAPRAVRSIGRCELAVRPR